MIKLIDMGYDVGILDLTAGESGSRGNAETRKSEAECASKVMGLKYRHNLGFPDAGLYDTQENALKLSEIIRQTKPELVILPYWKQRHPDHSAAGQIGYRGCFLAGLEKMPINGKPHRPRKIIYSSSFPIIGSGLGASFGLSTADFTFSSGVLEKNLFISPLSSTSPKESLRNS